METKHDLLIQNKRDIQFKFTIRRKLTFIRGNSATGKTTLFQMVSDANSTRVSGVTISCDVPVKALYETGYKYELENESGNIYIIDEDFGALKTKEFAALVLKSPNCFIIITRESLPAFPYSYKEIYEIKTSGKYHTLKNIYPEYGQFQEYPHMVTEDEDSGLEYYQNLFGNRVISSHGNSNLSKYGSPDTLLIGDGCAIGAFIQDLILTKSALYLPESFEWALLQNGMFQHYNRVHTLISQPEKLVDTSYTSMERYCSDLLCELTRNTPAQYSKSKINRCYLYPCCCKGIKCDFYVKDKKII